MMSDRRPELDFDHHSTEYAAVAWATNIVMSAHTQVSYGPHRREVWLITGFDQTSQAAHYPELPNSPGRPQGMIIPTLLFTGLPPEIYSPEFAAWRKALEVFFSPHVARRLRPRIQHYASWCMNWHIERGEIDSVLDLSNPLRAQVTLGLPRQEWRLYADAPHAAVYTLPDPHGRAGPVALGRSESGCSDLPGSGRHRPEPGRRLAGSEDATSVSRLADVAVIPMEMANAANDFAHSLTEVCLVAGHTHKDVRLPVERPAVDQLPRTVETGHIDDFVLIAPVDPAGRSAA
ncbi:hypothetical protein [Nocardia sp. NPDC004604]|uniref:hypothetical protein n=1 Tax=Nocardia sp. NPDC004604 TaxID=3157013 RepID=UPI0033BB3284